MKLLMTTAAMAGNNVLLIIADDYGTDASTLYNSSPGATLPPTPQINALAANGVRFTNAYAYPVCSPTRSCILTGRFGFRTGTGNVVSIASGNLLKAAEFTLPDAFAANNSLGYQLKHFGKWHLGSNPALYPCTIGGWPNFSGSLLGEISNYTSWTKVVSNGTGPGTTSTTVTTYATTDVVNDAVSFINTQTGAGKPWFAWVAFNAPHTPFHLPPVALCPHYTALSGTPADITAHPLNYYNAAVEALDTEIGRLLAAVDLSKTTVIFLGDNGTPGQVLQTPFPAGHGKDTLYEGGVRVPMIIRGPNVVSPGRTCEVMVHAVDLYSTILDLAGVPLPTSVTLDSQSLLPVIKNEVVTRSRLYSEEFDNATPTTGGRVLRDDRYKIIRNETGVDPFYDLQVDPYEITNLFAGGVAAMTAERQAYYYRLRFNLGKYTVATAASPGSSGMGVSGFSVTVPQVTVPQVTGTSQTLWRCTDLIAGFWAPVSGVTGVASGGNLVFTDPTPPANSAFYSVLSATP